MSKAIDVNIVNDSFFSSDNVVALIAVFAAVVTFIIERFITSRRERRSDKFNWFLTVIIEPQLPKICEFYDVTHEELKESINSLQNLPESTTITELIVQKREKIQLFKKRRASFFNNFVSMLRSYDWQLAVKIDNVINQLDDIYADSLDQIDESPELLLSKIYRNQTLFYAVLFLEIKKDS